MIELLMVVVIISLIAGFGIPSFTKGIERAKARDAINNLKIIHAAQQIHFARHDFYNAAAGITDINKINGAGSLNIIQATGVTYSCDALPECRAHGPNFRVFVRLDQTISGANPRCDNTIYTACP